MIPEHDNHGGLVCQAEILHQILESLVRTLHEGQVLVRLWIFSLIFAGKPYFLFKIVVGPLISAVVLHGYIEDKQLILRIFLGFHHLDQLLVIRLIAYIVAKFLAALVKFLVQERIKSHILIAFHPVPVFSGIRVHCHAVISLVLQGTDHGIGIWFYIELVGNGIGRQQGHGVPGKKLKLCVARHGTEHGHTKAAPDRVFLKAVHKGEIFCIGGKIACRLKLCQALVHNAY